ncbi:MAG TPA: hypothetical protein VFI46_01435, partial [Jiangellaceae bacterium]|nr:hypothetical protein [Jiangellaceae bacterium]
PPQALQEQGVTHWSARRLAQWLARHRGIMVSHDSIVRLWRRFCLQPHRSEGFKFSTDPRTRGAGLMSRRRKPQHYRPGERRPPAGHPWRCPDCQSTIAPSPWGEPFVAQLAHDDSCPTWAARAAALGIDRRDLVARSVDADLLRTAFGDDDERTGST